MRLSATRSALPAHSHTVPEAIPSRKNAPRNIKTVRQVCSPRSHGRVDASTVGAKDFATSLQFPILPRRSITKIFGLYESIQIYPDYPTGFLVFIENLEEPWPNQLFTWHATLLHAEAHPGNSKKRRSQKAPARLRKGPSLFDLAKERRRPIVGCFVWLAPKHHSSAAWSRTTSVEVILGVSCGQKKWFGSEERSRLRANEINLQGRSKRVQKYGRYLSHALQLLLSFVLFISCVTIYPSI